MSRSSLAPSAALALLAGSTVASLALAQPAIDADLGVLQLDTLTTRTLATPGAQVRWYRFQLAQPVQLADMTLLTIDTLGSAVLDTELGLYDASGNLLATDDDDAAGNRSVLTFGSGDNTFAGPVAEFTNVNNGRDGRLPAGTYYLAVSQFNAAFASTNWTVSVTPISTATANLTVNLKLGTASVAASPAGTVDLGVLQPNQTVTSTAGSLVASRPVQWYKVTLPEASNALTSFVDIDTEGTTLSPTNATRLAVYTAAGAYTGFTDLADGTNNLSQLTFGLVSPLRPAPDNGLNYNGRDGSLQAGTYFIGVAGTGSGPSQTNASGTNLQFTSGSANFGPVRLRIAAGAPTIPPVGTPVTLVATEGATGLLRIAVQPGLNPAASVTSVVVNASNIGGPASLELNDAGQQGDALAGDGVFSCSVQVNAPWQPNAVIDLPFLVTDALGRTGSGVHAVIANPSVTGACCAAGACTLTREYLCTSQGGAFAGPNTDCGGGPTYTTQPGGAFTPIASVGAPITFYTTLVSTAVNNDDGVALVTLPFPVTFYGQTFTQLRAVTNGFVQFTSDLTNWDNLNLPNQALPNNAIYAMWDDLLLTTSGKAYTATQGTAPSRQFIISWENVGQFDAQPSGTFATGSNSFQIVFHEDSSDFELRYGDIDAIANAIPSEDFVTIGCENADGSKAVAINVSAAIGAGNTSLRFVAGTTSNACATGCDSLDFNNNTVFPEDQDVIDFFNVLSGSTCAACNDIDFNNNGVFPEDQDVIDFFNVLAGGQCP